MNKTDLAARVSARTLLPKTDVDSAVSAVFSTIADALAAGDTVRIAGFGTFSTRFRPARQGATTLAPERESPSLPPTRLP